ncbi:cell division inhibitor SepF [Enterococcus sp. DIV2379]|uniref:cell division protein SepF n=1 Tax=Enterococcus sp. DIV2379 TaxID=2774684 RepID=UPI003D2F9E57
MSLKEKLTNFFGLTDEEDYYEETFATEEPARTVAKPAVNQGGAYTAPRTTASTRASSQAASYTTSQPQNQAYQYRQQPQTATYQQSSAAAERVRSVPKTEEKVVPMAQQRTNTRVKDTKAKETSPQMAGKITIVAPRVYSEAMGIAKQVINGDAVLVNFHLIEEYQARRIVDFLTGTVYAEDGDIKRVGDEIFLCTPKGMEIEGTAQTLADTNFFDI